MHYLILIAVLASLFIAGLARLKKLHTMPKPPLERPRRRIRYPSRS